MRLRLHKHILSQAMSSSSSLPSDPSKLPLKPLPGSYGLPFFGPIKDRLVYFYCQGRDKFFSTKIEKYKSTIFRTNMPPGPFISSDSRVIAVLDAISFQILFDTTKVEKRDIFLGTYMPSTGYTGSYRVCAYLDPSEPNHSLIKRFFISLLVSRQNTFIPLFRNTLSELFVELQDQISDKGEANLNDFCNTLAFNFVFHLFCDKNPADTKIGSKGPTMCDKWIAFHLAPLGTLGFPKLLTLLEDSLLRTLPFPSFLIKSDYKKLYDAIYTSATAALDQAEGLGLKRDEACHNLLFMVCFNAYGGIKTFFPALLRWVGLAGENLHKQLADEIRTVVRHEGGVSFGALDKMTLTKSVVYEALRIEPPVPYQYGKAKEDLVLHSHDAAFQIKKGEMIFGFQPFATKDPKIFENPDEFVGHRFVGEGEKLLKYVYWSNGRETENPTAEDKQCPGKNLVVLVSRLLIVEFFLRYDTFKVEEAKELLASTINIKSLTKASSI